MTATRKTPGEDAGARPPGADPLADSPGPGSDEQPTATSPRSSARYSPLRRAGPAGTRKLRRESGPRKR